MSRGEDLLTLGQAQKRLGMRGTRGLRLKAHLLAREKKAGVEIIHRRHNGRRTHYRVTMSALRRHCPELFPSAVDELQRGFRTYLTEIDERIASVADERISTSVNPKLQELWDRDEKIARNLKDLGRRFRDYARAKN